MNVTQKSGQMKGSTFVNQSEVFRQTEKTIKTSRHYKGEGKLHAFGDVTIDAKADVTIDAGIDTTIYE